MEKKNYLSLKRDIIEIKQQHNKLTALCSLLYSNILKSKSEIITLNKEIFLLKGGDINEYNKNIKQNMNNHMNNNMNHMNHMNQMNQMNQQRYNNNFQQSNQMNSMRMNSGMQNNMQVPRNVQQNMNNSNGSINDIKADQILKQLSEQNM